MSASSYSAPDVLVRQKRRTVTANRVAPVLPVCIVAPAVQIVSRALAGDYVAGETTTYLLPDLAAGALVRAASVDVLLNAADSSGKALGLFRLQSPDAELAASNDRITVNPSFALAYSLLSSRNNNQPNDVTDDIFSSGTPNAVRVYDAALDFLTLGAEVANTDVVVTAPAVNAGTYRIYKLIGSGSAVNEVKVEKLTDPRTGTKALNKSFAITGFANVNGTAVINTADTDAASAGMVGSLASVATADYPTTFVVPSANSADIRTLNFSAQAANVQTAWNALVAAASVGNYLRIRNDDVLGALNDFRITMVNKTTHEVSIQRVGATGTGTQTAGGGASATMELVSVLRGRSDQSNAAGDVLSMTIGGVEVDVEVELAQPTKITLVATISGLTGATNVTCRRGLPFRNSLITYDVVKRLTTGFTGQVQVSYRADRRDLSVNGLIEIADQTDIEPALGVIHPDNPIALMADMVCRSGLPAGGRTFYALVTDGDTAEAYSAALATLESAEVYFLVPGSQDQTVRSLFRAHAQAQSQPASKHERVVIETSKLVVETPVIPAIEGAALPTDGIVNSSDLSLFGSASTDWSLVSPGDVVKLMSDSTSSGVVIESKRVYSVDVVNKRCRVIGVFATDYSGASQVFKIDTNPLTKAQQAENWRDEAKAIQSSRCVLIRPDQVEITYTDTTGSAPYDVDVVVPSFYLACVIAGMKSLLPPQQPITNVPIPGIKRLYHANKYFSPGQLDVIAEGGNFIVMQDVASAAPYSRHQLTTDMRQLIDREFSIVVDVDYAAKMFRIGFRPFIGNRVINNEYLALLQGLGEGFCRQLVDDGSMLPGTSIEQVAQNADEPDSVIVDVGLKVPFPANKIYVTLYV